MKIAYLDGHRFRRALIAGAERLMGHAAQLNAINVFPVPDGDTGTNMASTARSIALTLRRAGPLSLGASLRVAADSALAGARGNSGAILAQFIQGLAEELGDEFRVTTKRFAKALRAASAKTRAALSRPREGTIITLLHDWSAAAEREAEVSDDFFVVLERAHEAADESLRRTKELMPELKKAGVVDAGAQGFFHVLDGIKTFIARGRLRDAADAISAELPEEPAVAADFDSLVAEHEVEGQRYCTEFFVVGEGIALDRLRDALGTLGDSVVVAGSARKARVHVHTNQPSSAFALGARFGDLESMKVDDMELQRRMAARGQRACAVLADSTSDLPDEERLDLLVERVPVGIELGGRRWLDRDGLTPEEFVALLKSPASGSPSTSQPSPADFGRKFDLLLGSAREVVYIGLASVLSGTLEGGRRSGAERAALAGRPEAVRVVDSRSVSVGSALIVRKAAEAAAAGAGADEVVEAAEKAIAACRLLVAVPDLSGLIRSGRLEGMKKHVLQAFGVRPLIGLDEEGRPVPSSLYFGKERGVEAILRRLARIMPRGRSLEAIVGHVGAPETAAALAREVEAGWRTPRPVSVTTICPALASHAGPGSVALAFLPAEADR